MAEDQIAVRRAKHDQLRTEGLNPYPDRFERSHALEAAAGLPEGDAVVTVAGRVVSKRQISKKLVQQFQRDAKRQARQKK